MVGNKVTLIFLDQKILRLLSARSVLLFGFRHGGEVLPRDAIFSFVDGVSFSSRSNLAPSFGFSNILEESLSG